MSTSPSYSFLVACARADSTAPNTTSRSTFFSREMASTSINSSRFMSLLSLRTGLTALEIDNRRQPSFLELLQRKSQRLQRRRLLVLAHLVTGLGRRLVAPYHLPTSGLRTLQRAAELLAIHGHLPVRGGAQRRLQG